MTYLFFFGYKLALEIVVVRRWTWWGGASQCRRCQRWRGGCGYAGCAGGRRRTWRRRCCGSRRGRCVTVTACVIVVVILAVIVDIGSGRGEAVSGGRCTWCGGCRGGGAQGVHGFVVGGIRSDADTRGQLLLQGGNLLLGQCRSLDGTGPEKTKSVKLFGN